MLDRVREFWFQLIGRPIDAHNKAWKYKRVHRSGGGLAKHVYAGTGTRPKVIPVSYARTRRRIATDKSLQTPPPTPLIAPVKSARIVHAKSSAKLIQDDDDESSDEEFTHIPVENIRGYDLKKAAEDGQPGGAGGMSQVYIDMPADLREVVCDPVEGGIHNWVERSFRCLYYYWLLLICLAVLMITLVMYMFYILNELHAKYLLTDLFWKSRYVNVAGITAVQMIVGGLGLVFLCFPDPRDWGLFKNTRWIAIVIPNLVMIVGLTDQVFWMFSYDLIINQLELLLWHSLAESALDPKYPTINTTMFKAQNYLECCGVRHFNDWEKATEFATWGFPFSCCDDSYVDSCEVPIKQNVTSSFDGSVIEQIWSTGCYEEELKVFQVTAGITWGVYIISVTSCVACSIYMWHVIRHRNLHNVDVFHPF